VETLQRGDPPRIGQYLLLGRLGSGGMGRVFLARSPGGRLVAVKAVRDELAQNADFRARFAREVAAVRRVGGLFTAPVVDADPDAPVPWLVTAYIAGPSLADAVTGFGPLPVASVLALAAGLAEGLDQIHAAGVIHRDLKPSNVLLADDGPRLIDFGISLAAEITLLMESGLVVGSPGFMSPEQAEGHDIGPASDIFSLGAVVAFAATGKGPFGTGPATALLYRVVHSPAGIESLPGQIRPLVARCLAKDPRDRPTAAQFLADLTATCPSAADLTDWLPAPILQAFSRYVPAAAAALDGPDVPATSVPAESAAEPSQGEHPATGTAPGAAAISRPRPADGSHLPSTVTAARLEKTPTAVAALPGPGSRQTPGSAGKDGLAATPSPGKPIWHALSDFTLFRAMIAVVTVLVLGAVASGIWAFSHHASAGPPSSPTHHPSSPPGNPGAASLASVLTPVSAHGFDPLVSRSVDPGDENDNEASRAIDSNPVTFWHTQFYLGNPVFGGTKTGTGLILNMRRPVRLSSVTVTFGSIPGANVQIKLGNNNARAPTTLATFTTVASATDVGGTHTFTTTSRATGRYVLIWFTKLPRQAGSSNVFVAQIYNIVVRGQKE
jgi:serine/threonine protein kinase